MKKASLLLFLFLPFSFAFSQIVKQGDGQVISASNFGFIHGDHLPDSFLKSNSRSLKYEDIQGTPYINNNQKLKNNIPTGKLYTSDNNLIDTYFIRYNAYSDNIELSIIDDAVEYYILKKKTDSWYAVLGENRYRVYNFNADDQIISGFLKIISKSDTTYCALLKQEKIIFKDEEPSDNAFITASPALFRRVSDTYYIKLGDAIQSIPKNQRHFIKLFVLKNDLLNNFLDSKKFKLSKESDLLEIVNYYNSIINQK